MRRLLTPKRLMVWALGLFAVSWFIHLHTMSTAGLVDRDGRVKGSDYVQFYVMGSLVRDGAGDALYDPQAHLAAGRRHISPDLRLYAAHPNYGPQVALAFVPLAALPYGWSLVAFLTLSALCYAAGVWMVWRECPALQAHGRVVAVLAAGSPLLLTVVRYGQASAVALLVCSATFVALRRGRPFLAGLALGCLAYKPQLGVVFGIVLVAARQWRVVAGAIAAVAVQLGGAWMVFGSRPLAQYGSALWLLLRNPALVEIHPSELHSVRGFVHLLVPYAPIVTICGIAAFAIAVVIAVRTWSSPAPLGLRFGEAIVLTILASPHLLAYDLLLLTIPLLLFADWAATDNGEQAGPAVTLCLVLLYFAPFSGMIVARLTGVQVSVIVMAFLAWRVYRSLESRAIEAPRCDAVSSQNSSTRGWRSSAA